MILISYQQQHALPSPTSSRLVRSSLSLSLPPAARSSARACFELTSGNAPQTGLSSHEKMKEVDLHEMMNRGNGNSGGEGGVQQVAFAPPKTGNQLKVRWAKVRSVCCTAAGQEGELTVSVWT